MFWLAEGMTQVVERLSNKHKTFIQTLVLSKRKKERVANIISIRKFRHEKISMAWRVWRNFIEELSQVRPWISSRTRPLGEFHFDCIFSFAIMHLLATIVKKKYSPVLGWSGLVNAAVLD
jgi:hypothetical protein